MKLKSASLETIAKANGKPTGDDLIKAEREAKEQARREEIASLPKYMNSAQRRKLRKVLANGEKE